MDASLQSFAEGLDALDSGDAVWAALAGFSGDRGLTACTLTMARRDGRALRSSRFQTSLPKEFADSYRGGLVGNDPFLALHCRSMAARPILTDPDRFPGAKGAQRGFLELTEALGVRTCLGIPVRIHTQGEFGGWVIGSDADESEFEAFCAAHGAELHLAALLAFERMAALARMEAKGSARLSPRERECLLWLSAGLRVAMIADRLALSEAAVNLYISNARAKLGARTREQAVARAILSGEIVP